MTHLTPTRKFGGWPSVTCLGTYLDVDGPVGDAEESLQAYLRWGSGVSIVFTGTLQSEVPGILKLAKVVLTVKHNSWWIELPIELNELQNYGDRALETPKWLTSVDPPQLYAGETGRL
jgi:hypothetical protein